MKFWIVLLVLVAIAAIIGEIKCIINFLNCDFKEPYKAEIIYGVGVITGLGSIFGWINFGK